MTPQGRAGKRRRKGAGKPCRENGTLNMPDIAAMPVGRKTTASAKRRDTLATDNFCHLPDFMLLFEELDKDCQVPHPRLLL